MTNGLLLTKLNTSVIKSIKNNDVIVNVSLYKPTLKIIDSIERFLINNNIKHRYGRGNRQILKEDYISKFHTCLSLNKKGMGKKINCYNQYCWFLRNNKIYKCPYPALINILNDRFNLNFEDNNSYCDLLECESGWDCIKKLVGPSDFCNYWRNYVKEYDWNNNKPELAYYLLDDD